MDESRLIDWYDVAEQVANGRFTGHACPICGARPLETALEGALVRVRCPSCGEGFEGRMGHGRDDAFYAEAQENEAKRRRASAAAAAPTAPAAADAAPPPTGLTLAAGPSGGPTAAVTVGLGAGAPGVTATERRPSAPAPRPRTAADRLLAANEPEPGAPRPQKTAWSWSLPAENAGDLDALALWADIVESVHNGRQAGLRCPMCSEPLTDIDHLPPYLRIRCGVCGEGFEGRIG